jgi:hypothetical protein
VALGKHARKQRSDTHAADEKMVSYQAPRIPFTLIAASRRQGLRRWLFIRKKHAHHVLKLPAADCEKPLIFSHYAVQKQLH